MSGVSWLCSSKEDQFAELWDWNQTWYTATPSFTSCFESTVLIWIPCIYLWVSFPIYYLYLRKNCRGYIRMSAIFKAKMVLGFALLLLSLSNAFYILWEATRGIPHAPGFIIAPPLQVVTMNPCPEAGASFASKITFWWFAGLLWKGYQQPLQAEDLWSLARENSSEYIVTKIEDAWNEHYARAKQTADSAKFKRERASSENAEETTILLQPERSKSKPLLKAFWNVFGTYFLFGTLGLVLGDIFLFLIPKTLRYVGELKSAS